ncbi:AP-3 complex subunit mu-2 [Gaertneriomyces sp. JEL0708]|nr:AP-3 complex subunit mu-2 [Gaertneriomyces sp. JEL0708]
MISSLFLISQTKVLIEKHYRKPIARTLLSDFITSLFTAEDIPPVTSIPTSNVDNGEELYVFWVKAPTKVSRSGTTDNGGGNVALLGVSTEDTPPASVLHFLHRTIDLFIWYFGALNETIVKDNFVIIYELLEELLDYGTPYVTSGHLLRALIPPPSLLSTLTNSLAINLPSASNSSPFSSTSSDLSLTNSLVPWRPAGLKYAQNEVFFDIAETLDCILDRRGGLVFGEVKGEMIGRTKLSGMPELVIRMSGRRDVLENGGVGLHPCVRISRFEKDGTLSFIPPDGAFTLLTYVSTLSSHQQLPFSLHPQLILKKSHGTIKITFSPRISGVNSKTQIENLAMSLTLPGNVIGFRGDATCGKVEFDQISKELRWTVNRPTTSQQGNGYSHTPVTLTGTLSMSPTDLPPKATLTLFLDFKIAHYTFTGLGIRDVQVLQEGYSPYKGLRISSKAGRVQMRV